MHSDITQDFNIVKPQFGETSTSAKYWCLIPFNNEDYNHAYHPHISFTLLAPLQIHLNTFTQEVTLTEELPPVTVTPNQPTITVEKLF